MGVNLAHQNPLEEHEDDCLLDEMPYEDLNYSIDKLLGDVQVLNSKLNNMKSAMDILKSNPSDPFTEFMNALNSI